MIRTLIHLFTARRITAEMAPEPLAAIAPAQPAQPRSASKEPTIAFVNKTSVLSDVEILPVVAALQIQLDRDFSPAWNMSAKLTFIKNGEQIPAGAWIIYLLDTSDQDGALGYHDLPEDTGLPIGKVFVKDDLKNNLSWSVTASHELLEMLADPYINSVVFVQQTNTTGVLFALEVADAVEDDKFGYKINDVLVSDFVYPAWFEAWRKPESTKFDHMNVVTQPFKLAEGGYISLFEVSPMTKGWNQTFAQDAPGKRFLSKPPSSRKNLRRDFNLKK